MINFIEKYRQNELICFLFSEISSTLLHFFIPHPKYKFIPPTPSQCRFNFGNFLYKNHPNLILKGNLYLIEPLSRSLIKNFNKFFLNFWLYITLYDTVPCALKNKALFLSHDDKLIIRIVITSIFSKNILNANIPTVYQVRKFLLIPNLLINNDPLNYYFCGMIYPIIKF